jgi:hypothetical protein
MSIYVVYCKTSHDANRVVQIPEIITNPRSYGTGPGHVDNHFLETGYSFKAGEGTALEAKILISCAQFFNAFAVRDNLWERFMLFAALWHLRFTIYF